MHVLTYFFLDFGNQDGRHAVEESTIFRARAPKGMLRCVVRRARDFVLRRDWVSGSRCRDIECSCALNFVFNLFNKAFAFLATF